MLAGPVCTRNDVNALLSAERTFKSASRQFDNSKIKDFCPAGRRLLAAFHRVDRIVKAHGRCTLATARDRREWAKIKSMAATAERQLRSDCR